jgi:iron only hydrogenase large subunit-like protein
MGDFKNQQHSVILDKERCIGCTDCIKRCPTEAIRVRNKKAVIIDERCIDCGMCIRVCKHKAKKARADQLLALKNYKVNIAIPAPTLYTQFKSIHNVNQILTGLKRIGFDEVFEVAKGAEIITDRTKQYIKETHYKRPLISSACPAVVKVIQSRFPSLIPNILPIISPKEAIARLTLQHYMDLGYDKKDIGIFFISPCAAKITNSRFPQTIESSAVKGNILIKDIYKPLLQAIKDIENDYEVLRLSAKEGMYWASSGGEGHATEVKHYIAVDGIENVIKVLEMIEDDELSNNDFVECLACTGGCLGGPLTVENPYVAKCRMEKVQSYHKATLEVRSFDFKKPLDIHWEKEIQAKEVLRLDEDLEKALLKMEALEEIYGQLPKIDCGSCGAPTCRALAEDIVLEQAHIEDCIFMLRAEVRKLAEQMVRLSEKLPQSIEINE